MNGGVKHYDVLAYTSVSRSFAFVKRVADNQQADNAHNSDEKIHHTQHLTLGANNTAPNPPT
jgi:hypothetical protein